MRDQNETKKQLLSELTELQQRIVKLEALEEERKRAEEELRESENTAKRLAKENAIIAEIGRIISSTLDIEQVYKAFSQKVKELIPFDRITINLVNVEGSAHTVPYVEGTFVPGRQPGDLVPLSGTSVEEVVRTRKGIVVRMEDEKEVADEFPGLLPDFRAGMRSGLTVPLISGDRVIGGLALRSIHPGIYTEYDLRLAENVSNQISGAIASARLHTERNQMEETLRKSEEKFRVLLDSAAEGVVVVQDEKIKYANRQALHLFAATTEQVKAARYLDFTHPDDRALVVERYRRRAAGEKVENRLIYRVLDRREKSIWVEGHASVMSWEERPAHLVFLTDITERKRTEEALRSSEEEANRLARENAIVAEIGQVISSTLNIDEVYPLFSAKVRILLPYDRIVINLINKDGATLINRYVEGDPAPQRNAGDVFPMAGTLTEMMIQDRKGLITDSQNEEDMAAKYPGLLPEFKAGSRSFLSVPLISGDKLIGGLHLRSRKFRFYSEKDLKLAESIANQIAGAIANAQLFAERKQVEEALLQSQRRFETLSAATFEGIVISEAGRLVDVNEQIARMFGYEPAELIGMEAAAMILPGDRERVLGNIRRGIDVNIEHGMLRKDGSVVVVEAHGRTVLYQGRQVRITAIRDITVRKQAEEEKERLEAQLVQAQKMESIGRLAGGVAHDFNNMLGVIIGRVEMALEQVNPAASLHRNLREIQKAAHRSADLTRQLLAFARRQTVSPKVLDLNDTVSGMLKMLKRLIGEDIDLVWIPGHDLWKVRIDPSQIDQILANLTVNARDAILGAGSVVLKTENVALDESYCADHAGCVAGEYVLLMTSDTGSGMNQEVLDHLFEPFFTTKEMGKGTGLGLATVYGIVKQNDGFIDVESELGKGTTFRIYVPRFETKTGQESAQEEVQKPRGGTESILLVEDDETILGLCKEILENLGYKVAVAQTPSRAIRLVEERAEDIQLLITDVVMPGMSGRELAERITAIKPGLKCLYMSGYTADMIAHRGVLDEGIHFIQKPFRPNDFAKAIREVLEEK